MPLTNTLHFGFHPLADLPIGDPHIPRNYDVHPLPQNIFNDNLVDDQPYHSYDRGDLCLEYIYEVGTQYMLGGELVTVPVIHRVFRRDPDLRWTEIRTALMGGPFPVRYRSTDPSVGPMNHATFQKFINRFYLAHYENDSQNVFEKGMRRPIQREHEDCEWILHVMLPNMHSTDDGSVAPVHSRRFSVRGSQAPRDVAA
ncbi:hypothetical protein B0H14DRAFT_3139573 [Mycena olivaceomarginata]|nr:hypothetical protein B0H14DRAFT_3139573 [Mycena olivaceomarginata]